MLIGNIKVLGTYKSLLRHNAFRKALSWIQEMPLDHAPGVYEIQGEEIFVNIHGYDTLPVEECQFESHRKYIDIQYCIEGGEVIETEWSFRLEPEGEFDLAGDRQSYQPGRGRNSIHMSPGDFAIFFPEDAHRPKVHDGQHSSVRKLVVKVNWSLVHGPNEVQSNKLAEVSQL